MSWNKNNIVNEPPGDDWGGPWTEKKLQAFSKYVWSYLTIMKNFPFWETIYFDGFAGSGTKEKEVNTELYKQLKITEAEEKTYKGAAERVLTLKDDLTFNYYYFIDKEEKSLNNLKAKLKDIKGKKLVFRSGDMNKHIKDLAKALLTKERKLAALIFLDPFGMQIDWTSIEALKGSRSDVWILVPTGVIVNRLLDRAGKLELAISWNRFSDCRLMKSKKYFTNRKRKILCSVKKKPSVKFQNPLSRLQRFTQAV